MIRVRCDRCSCVPDDVVDMCGAIAVRVAERSDRRVSAIVRGALADSAGPAGLTGSERRLYAALEAVSPDVVSREDLFAAIGARTERGGESRTVDVHMCRLRRKLEPRGYVFEMERGNGYGLLRTPRVAEAVA